MKKKNHSITLLLPILLFTLFMVLAVSVILFAARIYERDVASAKRNFTSRTAVSYVTQKLHSADTDGAVSVGTFHGQTAIILTREIAGTRYHTYIYEYRGELCELFTEADNSLPASAGSKVLPVSAFDASMETDHLISFTITAQDGTTVTARTALLSGGSI